MDIPTLIRLGRRKHGLSQRALADRLRLAPSAVAQWETGKTLPDLDNRVELSQLLGIPFSEMMPEAAVLKDALTGDKRTLLLVEKFQALPVSVQEAILMQVSAVESALSGKKPGSDN